MKTIDVDEELYSYIASHTQHIGESASEILRRMLNLGPQAPGATCAPAATDSADNKTPPVTPRPVKTTSQDPVRVMRELLLSDSYAEKKKTIDRFMLVLSALYNIDPQGFSKSTDELHGRTRVYFAGDEHTLLASGKTSKPRHIPGTPFWVITNTNTQRKQSMVEQIMQGMGFPANTVEKVCNTL
ncbi:replication initiation negative regulator SeqA [Morganella morganii]|uniref:Negative modulator of initiation of replication n=1 Tax=Morganella morganii TaxID=582 RepID=A0AAI9MRD7_MORMO|nr:replication initiation negative regulator SeqA [Morganella morganii]HCE8949903.1 replication initiation negative regulator SeqA [Morganella morganii]